MPLCERACNGKKCSLGTTQAIFWRRQATNKVAFQSHPSKPNKSLEEK